VLLTIMLAALGIAMGASYALFIERRPIKAPIYALAMAVLLPTLLALFIALAPIVYTYVPPLLVAALCMLAIVLALAASSGRR